jgi:hypothetical protein
MKLGKTLYVIAIMGMAIISIFLFKHDLVALGYVSAVLALGALVRLLSVIRETEIAYSAEARKKRRERWQKLTPKEKEMYLDIIEKEFINEGVKLN